MVFGWPSWESTEWSGEIDADPSSPFKMMVVSELRDGELQVSK